ncbi:MAG: exodeoxyribonuclease III [Halieaceae bacterium]|nr:exodeoxyribonuclease III [Halieaceae bacterium]
MRVISLSADGLPEAADKGLYDWLDEQSADIVCIQDLGCSEDDLQADRYFPPAYNPYFFAAADGETNGVAIYCKELPKAIMTGLGGHQFDLEGCYIQADYANLSFGSILIPHGGEAGSKESLRREEFLNHVQAHLQKIRHKRREYIFCGGWRLAHTAADVQDTEKNSNNSGFLAGERQWLDEVLASGYVDAFREINSDSDEFSWWPNGERDRDGWRTDFQLVSEGLKYSIEYGAIYTRRVFSSHAPVIMDYDIELTG